MKENKRKLRRFEVIMTALSSRKITIGERCLEYTLYLQKNSDDFYFRHQKNPKIKPSEILKCPNFLQCTVQNFLSAFFLGRRDSMYNFKDNVHDRTRTRITLTSIRSFYLWKRNFLLFL